MGVPMVMIVVVMAVMGVRHAGLGQRKACGGVL